MARVWENTRWRVRVCVCVVWLGEEVAANDVFTGQRPLPCFPLPGLILSLENNGNKAQWKTLENTSITSQWWRCLDRDFAPPSLRVLCIADGINLPRFGIVNNNNDFLRRAERNVLPNACTQQTSKLMIFPGFVPLGKNYYKRWTLVLTGKQSFQVHGNRRYMICLHLQVPQIIPSEIWLCIDNGKLALTQPCTDFNILVEILLLFE